MITNSNTFLCVHSMFALFLCDIDDQSENETCACATRNLNYKLKWLNVCHRPIFRQFPLNAKWFCHRNLSRPHPEWMHAALQTNDVTRRTLKWTFFRVNSVSVTKLTVSSFVPKKKKKIEKQTAKKQRTRSSRNENGEVSSCHFAWSAESFRVYCCRQGTICAWRMSL